MPRARSSVHLLCMLHLDARWRAVVFTTLLLSRGILAGEHDVAMAQTIDPALWVTNGPVNAVVQVGEMIYIGGDFTQVGPATGGAVPLDAATGQPVAIPKVAGLVNAVAPDGTGGWYVAGRFTHVGGVPRSNIAHILADNTVSTWNPNAEGPDPGVFALAVSGTTVYAGGIFTSIGGQARNNLAALDASTGLATGWDPNVEGVPGGVSHVLELAVSGSTVYVGGFFTSIGGQMRNHLAALDASTGLATPWNPNANAEVRALALSGSTVYAGGFFTSIGGQPRNYIAALDISSGLATAWNPIVDRAVFALAVSDSTVYVGGDFFNVSGLPRYGVAALDASGGWVTSWNPSGPYMGNRVSALAVNGSTVYVGGIFTNMGGQARNNIAALRASNGNATAWDPNPNDGVFALAVSGSTVYAGGRFTSVGGQARNRIAALDASTGIATAWNPGACCDEVKALAVNGSTVYAGGSFTGIGGQARNRIAALDASSGLATAWNPNANDPVLVLAVSGSTVYAGGQFTSIGGQTRNRIAALDASSGLATGWNPNAGGIGIPDPYLYVRALAVSGNTVYAGGSFTSIGGQARTGIAALDASSGLATAWNPYAGGLVEALTISGSTVYAGGIFSTIGGQARKNIGAVDVASGLATAWDPNAAGGGVLALAVSGSTVYAGGSFTSIGGEARNNIAALDALSGLATPWNPNTGGYFSDDVYALTVSGSTVYAGGSFTQIGGWPQSGIAAIAADAYTATLLAQFLATANDAGVELRWCFSDPSIVAAVRVERAPATQGPWIAIDVDRHSESEQTVAIDPTAEFGHDYFYRLIVHLRDGSTTQFGPVSVRGARILQSTLELVGPNPTRGAVQIRYAVARYGRVRLELIDLNGRVVATLVDKDHSPGRYLGAWDGRDGNRRVASAIYFLRLSAPDRTAVRKFTSIR